MITGILYIFMNMLIMLIKLSAQAIFLLALGRQSNDISKIGLAWNPQTMLKNQVWVSGSKNLMLCHVNFQTFYQICLW